MSEATPLPGDRGSTVDDQDGLAAGPGLDPETVWGNDGVSRAHHLFLIMIVSVCVLLIGWAGFFELDVFSMAEGEVAPASQVKSVQHLEGGIVSKILVREGTAVEPGQPLMELETTASDADVQELRLRLADCPWKSPGCRPKPRDGKSRIFRKPS